MLLRPLWSRLGAQQLAGNKKICSVPLIPLGQCLKPRDHESAPRIHSWSRPATRTPYVNTSHQQHMNKTHVHPAVFGFQHVNVPLLTFPETPINWRYDQTRFHSANIVKSVLKPTLTPAIVPPKGKRPPKGPRTKQPSRANQPSMKQDEVIFTICCCMSGVGSVFKSGVILVYRI